MIKHTHSQGHIFQYTIVTLLLFFHHCYGDVTRFECGNDRCIPNVHYCSHEDTTDMSKWICSLCEEEKWKCRDSNINPQCLGYCEQIEKQVLRSEFEREKDKCNRTIEDLLESMDRYEIDNGAIMAGWDAANKTIQSLEASLSEKNKQVIILVIGLVVSVLGFTTAIILYCWCRRRSDNTRHVTPCIGNRLEVSPMLKKCESGECGDVVQCCCVKRGTRPKENGGKTEICPNEVNIKTEY